MRAFDERGQIDLARKKHKEAALIIAVFLLLCIISFYRQAGLHVAPADTIRPVVIYAAYVMLLAWWWATVRSRVTQRNMRVFLLAESILMLLGITIRFIHDAFTQYFTNVVLTDSELHLIRFSGYLNALPFILAPLFGLFASFGLGKTEDYKFQRNRYLLLVPGIVIPSLLLTNDIHHLIFQPLQDEINDFLYFRPRAGFYVMIAWAFALLFARVFVVRHRSREAGSDSGVESRAGYARLVPLIFTVLVIVVNIPYMLAAYVVEYELMEQSILLFFIEICIWETSIIAGMVPVNTRYDEVFDRSTVAMQILGEDGDVRLSSSTAVAISHDMFELLKKERHARMQDGIEFHLHTIMGGYAVWQTDVSETVAVISELQRSMERLEHDSELVRQELAAKSEEAAVREKIEIYSLLAGEVTKQLTLLHDLLNECEHGVDTDALFKKICLIGAYIKRRCNLRLIEQSDNIISNQELDLCFMEIIGCLEQMDISAKVVWRTHGTLAPEFAICAFDVFQFLIEREQFALDAIHVSFDTNVDFTIEVFSDSGVKGSLLSELQRLNKADYRLSVSGAERGYRVVFSG
ncbi:MAG: hypothetical protein FWH33_08310 [Oscillospiraceae bacterium]|nr:hypothetical protein [Oscillospiraceae bacterium]